MIYDNVVLQTTVFLFKVTYGVAIGFYNKGFHPFSFLKATYETTLDNRKLPEGYYATRPIKTLLYKKKEGYKNPLI